MFIKEKGAIYYEGKKGLYQVFLKKKKNLKGALILCSAFV
jgi:hypothetical protein